MRKNLHDSQEIKEHTLKKIDPKIPQHSLQRRSK